MKTKPVGPRFAEIKAGDFVWLGRGSFPHQRIAQIEKVTYTQFVIDTDRYYRHNGRRVGGSSFLLSIIGPATMSEVAVWNRQQEVKKSEDEKRARERKAIDAERERLTALLPRGYVNDEDGRWTVTVGGLSAVQVEELAPLLRRFGAAEPCKAQNGS